jgi:hypothetical protein
MLQACPSHLAQCPVQRHLSISQQIPRNSRQNSRPGKQVDQLFLWLGRAPFRFKFSRCCLQSRLRLTGVAAEAARHHASEPAEPTSWHVVRPRGRLPRCPIRRSQRMQGSQSPSPQGGAVLQDARPPSTHGCDSPRLAPLLGVQSCPHLSTLKLHRAPRGVTGGVS